MTAISSDVIRGYNDTIILYILLDEPSYGYEISKKIRALSEDKYIIKELNVGENKYTPISGTLTLYVSKYEVNNLIYFIQ